MIPPVWVTGAQGFIGRHLAKWLAESGRRVGGIGHGLWPAGEAAVWGVSCWVNGDVSASNLHVLLSQTGKPAIIVHLAGGSSVGAALAQPREDFLRTVGSTAELFEWVRIHSPETAVVAVSSAAVYGSGHVGPIAESATLQPYSPYGQHKSMMESLCRSYGTSYGIRSIVARLFSVYGPGLQKQLLWDLCCRLEAKSQVVQLGGSGEEVRDWIEVSDVVRILAGLGALASEQVPTLNVGTGVGVRVRDVAQLLLARWFELHGERPALTFSGHGRPGDPFSLIANVDALCGQGLSAASHAADGIARYVDWYSTRSQRSA